MGGCQKIHLIVPIVLTTVLRAAGSCAYGVQIVLNSGSEVGSGRGGTVGLGGHKCPRSPTAEASALKALKVWFRIPPGAPKSGGRGVGQTYPSPLLCGSYRFQNVQEQCVPTVLPPPLLRGFQSLRCRCGSAASRTLLHSPSVIVIHPPFRVRGCHSQRCNLGPWSSFFRHWPYDLIEELRVLGACCASGGLTSHHSEYGGRGV